MTIRSGDGGGNGGSDKVRVVLKLDAETLHRLRAHDADWEKTINRILRDDLDKRRADA